MASTLYNHLGFLEKKCVMAYLRFSLSLFFLMLSVFFLFTDTFHEVRRRRDRKKEVRFSRPSLLALES